MQLDELIRKLQKLRAMYGNVKVLVCDDMARRAPVVEYFEAGEEYNYSPGKYEHISL